MRKLMWAASLSLLASLVIVGCAAKPRAGSATAAAAAAAPAPAPDPRNKVIVHIVNQHQTITVTSSPQGLLYSLTDPSGRVQVADATEARFAELQPELFRQIKHYIAVHADDAPVVSAGTDAPIPSARLDGPTPALSGDRRSFSGSSSDSFKRTADRPFPTAREDAPE